MAKVTGKFQITLPKKLIDQCGIMIGDELEFRTVGRSILIDRADARRGARVSQERLRHFDQATQRQAERQAAHPVAPVSDRGWTRDQLYNRGRAG